MRIRVSVRTINHDSHPFIAQLKGPDGGVIHHFSDVDQRRAFVAGVRAIGDLAKLQVDFAPEASVESTQGITRKAR